MPAPKHWAGARFGTHALLLAEQGWPVIPIRPGTKVPAIRDWWRRRSLTEISELAQLYRDCGIGIALGHDLGDGSMLVAIDGDSSCRDLSERLLGELPEAQIVRVGRAPRFATLARVPVGTPCGTTAKYGSERHHVALLGPGRQLVVFGEHPDTHREYRYRDLTPLDLPVSKVMFQPMDVLQRLGRTLDTYAAIEGWQQVEAASWGEAQDAGGEDAVPDMTAPLNLTQGQVRELMAQFQGENADYNKWTGAGMAWHHQSGGERWGLQQWIEWSRSAPNFGGCEEKWETFAAVRTGRVVTMATYLWRAKRELGWAPKAPPLAEEDPVVTRPLQTTPIGAQALAQHYTPPDVIEGLVPRDAGGLVSPGGLGKTTVQLWQAIHVVLGRPFCGHEITQPGPVLYVTAEDDAATLAGRLGHICRAMGLSEAEQQIVADNVYIEDVSTKPARLVRVLRDRTVVSAWTVSLIDAYRPLRLSLVLLDPFSLIGPGEESGNDGMSEGMRVMRRMSRELGAAVQATHHTGQQVARERIRDQYAGRGGTAWADNSRFQLQLDRIRERTFRVDGIEWQVPAEVRDEDLGAGRVLVLIPHKHSYRALRAAPIVLVRDGWAFAWYDALPGDDIEVQREVAGRELVDDMATVLAVLRTELEGGTQHSRNALEDMRQVLLPGVSRTRLRAALTRLLQTDQVVERVEGQGDRRGVRRWLEPR